MVVCADPFTPLPSSTRLRNCSVIDSSTLGHPPGIKQALPQQPRHQLAVQLHKQLFWKQVILSGLVLHTEKPRLCRPGRQRHDISATTSTTHNRRHHRPEIFFPGQLLQINATDRRTCAALIGARKGSSSSSAFRRLFNCRFGNRTRVRQIATFHSRNRPTVCVSPCLSRVSR